MKLSKKIHKHSFETNVDRSLWRWTVDYPEDLQMANSLFDIVNNDIYADYNTLSQAFLSEPKIQEINRHLTQGSMSNRLVAKRFGNVLLK